MNIFFLDEDPFKCPEYYYDTHVRKMLLETAQIMCSVYWKYGFEAPYRPSHVSQASVLWASACYSNFVWVKKLFMGLCKEYKYRFKTEHKTIDIMLEFTKTKHAHQIFEILPEYKIPLKGLYRTPFIHIAIDMNKSGYSDQCVVKDYREYYKNQKAYLKQYTKREEPEWLNSK